MWILKDFSPALSPLSLLCQFLSLSIILLLYRTISISDLFRTLSLFSGPSISVPLSPPPVSRLSRYVFLLLSPARLRSLSRSVPVSFTAQLLKFNLSIIRISKMANQIWELGLEFIIISLCRLSAVFKICKSIFSTADNNIINCNDPEQNIIQTSWQHCLRVCWRTWRQIAVFNVKCILIMRMNSIYG